MGRVRDWKMASKINDVAVRCFREAAWGDGSMLHLKQLFSASFRSRLWPWTDVPGSQNEEQQLQNCRIGKWVYLCPHQELGTTAPQLCRFEKEHSSGGHPETSVFPFGSIARTVACGWETCTAGTATAFGAKGKWYSSSPGEHRSVSSPGNLNSNLNRLILFPYKLWRTITSVLLWWCRS